MNYLPGFGRASLCALAILFLTAGCHANPSQVAAGTNQVGVQDPASDPATANLAPDVADTGVQAPAVYSAQQSAPPQPYAGGAPYQGQNQYQNSGDPGYGQQPVAYAPEPPPPLPYYDQPYAPGDDYIWTPGYWYWSPEGYYWVPGAWVEAPYEGALWTPGYWGFWQGRYGFYRGYWGPHIGYYGGIDYGFGYFGFGYEGGYWGGGHFYYNRSVNRLNAGMAHYVYDRAVSENNRGGTRVSFNGGSGGIQMRARPEELSALREQHAPPMRAQLENEHAASTNRAQFANVTKGRPASVAVSKPLQADRNVRAPAGLQQQRQASPQQQRQAAPQQQRQASPQQHQAAPQRSEEEKPK